MTRSGRPHMVHGSIRQRLAWARANGESGVAAGPDRHRSIAHLWARAAHDLRYPVQAALLQAKMLEGASEPAALTRTAGHIEGALRCLGDMLEMLILLSRIEAGLQTASLRTCDLAEVLEPILRRVDGDRRGAGPKAARAQHARRGPQPSDAACCCSQEPGCQRDRVRRRR